MWESVEEFGLINHYAYNHPSTPPPGMCLWMQAECLLSEMLGTECVLNFFFRILEYLHIHNEISWGWEPNLNRNSYLFPAHLRHILTVILYNIFFSARVFWLWSVTWSLAWEFLLLPSLGAKEVLGVWSILESGFWVRHSQPVYISLGRKSYYLSFLFLWC